MLAVLTVVLSVLITSSQATLKKGEDYQIVDFDDVMNGLLTGTIRLMDVRTAEEFKCPGFIPGSFNVPVEDLPGAFQMDDETFTETYGVRKPATPGSEVVVSCQSGTRARQAIDLLVPLGYTDLKLYAGSFQDWVDNEGTVISDC